MKQMTQVLARITGRTRAGILTAALTLLATACSTDEYPTNEPQGDRVAIEVGAGMTTRATDTSWHAQDAIGLFTLDPATSAVVDGQANYRYLNQSAAGATATFAPADAQNTAYFPVDGSRVSVLAYYPYNSAWTPGSGTLPVPVNVADQTSLPAIDLMTSAAVQADKSQPAVQLSFVHRLTKLSITLQADASFPAGTDLSTATLTLTGTPATAQYDLVAQSLTPAATAQDIALPVTAASGGTATSQAIVIPTAAGKGVAFTIAVDGDEYTGKLPDNIPLGTGEEVTVTITLKKSKAEIEASIRPWGQGASEKIDIVGSIKPDDLSNLPGSGSIEITTGNQTGNYTWDGTQLITHSPITWDDLSQENNHDFIFRFTPDASGKPQKDILEGSANAVAWGADIAFGKLYHANATFIVTQVKGSTYSDTEWNASKRTLLMKGFSATAYEITDPNTIVEPTTIDATHTVELEMNGFTHIINLKDKFTTFEAGKIYSLEATVNKSGISGISIGEVEEWKTGDKQTGTFD